MSQRITTLLTLAMVGFWIITAVVRLWQPWPEASVLDAAITPIIGYWFISNAKAKDGNGATT